MIKQIEGQMSIFDFLDRDSWSGKTCQEPSLAMAEKTFVQCLKKPQKWQKGMPAFLDLRGGAGRTQDASWEMGGALLGEYTMHSFGEYPSEESVSLLSQILEDTPHQKYCLSAKACQGILRRAEKRGKTLPIQLENALKRQSVSRNVLDVRGGVKEFSSNEKEPVPCQHSTTNQYSECQLIENHPNDSRVKIREDGMVQTLSSRMGTGGGNVPMVMESTAWDGSQISSTLTANNANGAQRMPDKDNFNAIITFTPDSNVKNTEEEVAYSMLSRDYKDPMCVAYGLDRASFNQGENAKFDFAIDEEKVSCQVSRGPGAVCNTSIVRRLTPMECERLQGYPDHWTDIGDWVDSKGKTHKGESDSPRYKALGNSIALPFWQWMAERMVKQLDEEQPTMASLFDGIGGFPLVFQRCGCTPMWASEIEEFPIAVTKIRFPDNEDEK